MVPTVIVASPGAVAGRWDGAVPLAVAVIGPLAGTCAGGEIVRVVSTGSLRSGAVSVALASTEPSTVLAWNRLSASVTFAGVVAVALIGNSGVGSPTWIVDGTSAVTVAGIWVLPTIGSGQV